MNHESYEKSPSSDHQRFLKHRTVLIATLLVISAFIGTINFPPVRATSINSTFGTPVMDGFLGFGEWNFAGTLTLPHGTLIVMNDGIRIYFLVDLTGDTGGSSGDYFWLTFDVNKNGAITANTDVNYVFAFGTHNMRYQYYLAAGTWTGLQPTTLSSIGEGFGCFFADGTFQIHFSGGFPPSITTTCNNHRVWEMGIAMSEVGATAGGSVKIGLRTSSQNPGFTDDTPTNFFSDFSNLITVNLAAAALPAANAQATFSFEQNPLEVTQAIQMRDNSLPLVANKATATRVYVDTSGAPAPQPVAVYLYGSRGGADLPGSPLVLIQQAPATVTRSTTADTANFLLPASWIGAGTVTLSAVTRSFSGTQQTTSPISITFTGKSIPTYWIVPVNTGTAQAPVLVGQNDINTQESYLRALFPLPNAYFVQTSWTALPANPPDVIASLNSLFVTALIAWIFSGGSFTLPGQIYGFMPSGGGLSDPVWAGGAGWVARGYQGTSLEGTMTHEIDHNLDRSATGTWGRHDPFDCGAGGPNPSWPYTTDKIQDVGFDTRTMQAVPATYPDIMSYCQSGALPTKWIAPYRWQNLFNNFPADPSTINSYYITGNLNSNNTGHLNPIYSLPALNSTIPSGPYSIDVLNSVNSILSSTPFNATFIDVEGNTRSTSSFSFQIPAQAGAAKIQLKRGTTLLDQIIVSSGVPTVTITSPISGAHWTTGTQTITWTASDPDGDPLQFNLLYSTNNGTTWTPLANNIQGNSYKVDPTTLAGGSSVKLRIIVTDGFNTATSDSAAFIIDDKPPTVTLFQPASGSILKSRATITFQTDATDLENASIPDSSFIWSYDGNIFGTGRTIQAVLPSGTHQINMTVIDNAGQTTTKLATITVQKAAGVPVFTISTPTLLLVLTYMLMIAISVRRKISRRSNSRYQNSCRPIAATS